MLRIGLTGGIGAGKSTASALLREHGAAIIDADAIAREVVEPGAPALEALQEAFGPAIITEDGCLDRAALAAAAFADPESTARLNAIMHPAIGERTLHYYALYADSPVVVHDVPLLVENGSSDKYHLSILVDATASTRLDRLLTIRGMDEDDARRRIAAQATDEERYRACDVILDNNGPADLLGERFEQLWATRLWPFAQNLRSGACADPIPAAHSHPLSEEHLPARTAARILRALGDRSGADVDVDVVDPETPRRLRGAVRVDASAQDSASQALLSAGYPLCSAAQTTAPVHGSADPGCSLHLELSGS